MKILIAQAIIFVLASSQVHAQSTFDCQKLFRGSDIDKDSTLRDGEASSFLSRMDEAKDSSSISYEEFMIACRKGSFNSVGASALDYDGWTGPPLEAEEMLKGRPSGGTTLREEQFGNIPAGLRASDLLGKPVYTLDDAHVGRVKDMAFSKDGSTGQLILAVGGFLGLGEKYITVEISQLRFVAKDDNLVVILDAAESDLADFNIEQ